MTLSDLRPGQWAVILEICCGPALSGRLEDLGLLVNQEVCCLHRAPSGTPAAYEIQGAAIALRRDDAARIRVREGTPCAGNNR